MADSVARTIFATQMGSALGWIAFPLGVPLTTGETRWIIVLTRWKKGSRLSFPCAESTRNGCDLAAFKQNTL